MFKIVFMVGLMLAGLVLNLGGGPTHDRLGFRYWRDPGAFAAFLYPGAKGRFLGWFMTLPWAGYSYVGIEAIGLAVAEVKHPRRSIPRAIKRVFARIAIFYVGGILIVGTLVPYTQSGLLQATGTGAQSPWVLALGNAGLSVWPSIANAAFLLFAFSASTTAMYVGSRALHALAVRGHAPKFFARTSRSGRPWVAATALAAFLPLSYMAVSRGAATAFGWFMNLTALTSFIAWLAISGAYLRFHAACRAQGVARASLPYTHWGQPWFAIWAAVWSTIVILLNGWYLFTAGNWVAEEFVVRYVNLAVTVALVLGYVGWKRPKWVRASELDLWSGVPSDEVGGDETRGPWWRRVLRWCFG